MYTSIHNIFFWPPIPGTILACPSPCSPIFIQIHRGTLGQFTLSLSLFSLFFLSLVSNEPKRVHPLDSFHKFWILFRPTNHQPGCKRFLNRGYFISLAAPPFCWTNGNKTVLGRVSSLGKKNWIPGTIGKIRRIDIFKLSKKYLINISPKKNKKKNNFDIQFLFPFSFPRFRERKRIR